MRWDAQRLDLEDPSALPGMPGIRGLLRSVQVPEFPGLTFHEVRAKSALNHVPGESAMPFPWTINPYRGCSHACLYCYARRTHEWLELDAGKDFDTQIVVKTNLVDVLRREARPAVVAAGTRGSGHQHRPVPASRGPLQADARRHPRTGRIRHPVCILTKGALLRRDIPLLVEAAPEGARSASASRWPSRTTTCPHALEPGVPDAREPGWISSAR